MIRRRYLKASGAAIIVLLGSGAVIFEILRSPAITALPPGQASALLTALVLTTLIAAGSIFALIVSRQPPRVVLPAAAFAERGLRLQLVTASLTDDLSSINQPEKVFQLTCLTVKEALNADLVAVFEPRMDGSALQLTGTSETVDRLGWLLPATSRHDLGARLSASDGLVVTDLQAQPDLGTEYESLGEGWRALASQPLISPGRPMGAVVVFFRRAHEFSADEIAFLRVCSGLCSVHLARTRAAQHRALRWQVERILDSVDTPEGAVQQVLQAVSNQYRFDLAEFWAAREDKLTLQDSWKALFLPAQDFLAESESITVGAGRDLPGRTWRSASVTWMDDIHNDPEFTRRKLISDLPLTSAVGVPVMDSTVEGGSQIGGVMVLYSPYRLLLTPELSEGLRMSGELLGTWLARSKRDLALRDSEARFRSLAGHAFGIVKIGLVILDEDERIVWANRPLTEMLGLESEGFIGRLAHEAFLERFADEPESAREFALLLGRSYRRREHLTRYVFQLRGTDGRAGRWLEYSSQPIEEGQFKGGRSEVFLDISRRMQIEQELRRRIRQQEAIASLGRNALSYDNLDQLMDESVRILCQNLGVEFSKLVFLDRQSDTLELQAVHGWQGEVTLDEDLSDPDMLVGYSLHSTEPVVVQDFESNRRFRRSSLLKRHAVRSGICAVVPGSSKHHGVLAAFSTEPHRFSSHDVTFVQAVANMLGDAASRVRTASELQQTKKELESRVQVRTEELERANETLAMEVKERNRAEETARSLLTVAQRLASTLEIDALLEQGLREAIALVGAEGGCVGLRQRDRMIVRHCLHKGEVYELDQSWESGESWPGWVMEHRQSYISTDISSDPIADKHLARTLEIRSLICVPLLDNVKQTTAFIQVHNKESGQPFSEVDHQRLETLSQIAAVSLQNALAFEKLRRAEEELSISRSQLLEAQQIAQIGNWEWDIARDSLQWSDELLSIYGVERGDSPESFEEFIEKVHPEDRELARQTVEAAYRDHSPFAFRHRIITPPGDVRILSARGRVDVDEHGKPIRMFGTGQDITASTLLEEALSAQTELYDSLLEAQSDLNLGVLVLENGRLLYANEALARMTGIPRSAMESPKQIYDLIRVEPIGRLDELLESQRTAPGRATGSHVEAALTSERGQTLKVELAIKQTPAQGEGRTFIIVRDVTPQRRSAETIQAMLTISQRLNATLEPESILKIVVQEARDLVDASAGMAALVEDEAQELTHSLGLLDSSSPAGGLDLDQEAFAEFSENPEFLVAHEIEGSPVRPLQNLGPQINALIRAPIRDRQGKFLGALELYSNQAGKHFDKQDQERLTGLSQIAAIALQNALAYRRIVRSEEALKESRQQLREFAMAQDEVLEDERRRIAREIHDELGGALTGLKMDIAAIRSSLSAGGDEPLHSAVLDRADQMESLVADTINTVRRIASDLRPGVLDDLGVVAALEWLAGDFTRRTGVRAVLTSNVDELAVDRPTASSIFRVVQEALTNISRHARANRVEISVNRRDHALQIEVIDDGVGFDPQQLDRTETLGLIGVRERIAQLNGSLEVISAQGEGTHLKVAIPMGKPDQVRAPQTR